MAEPRPWDSYSPEEQAELVALSEEILAEIREEERRAAYEAGAHIAPPERGSGADHWPGS